MQSELFCGWDLGGAHLKLVVIDTEGELQAVRLLRSPLWKGLGRFDEALAEARAVLPKAEVSHAVTMTGELSDIFPDRQQGVQTLTSRFLEQCPSHAVWFYAGPAGLIPARAAAQHGAALASANWHAAALFSAARCANGMLIDIGSTTTDIVVLRAGEVRCQGHTDAERLQRGELIYSGALRTPVMALTRSAPFGGEWQGLTAEHFATMADVYVLSGALAHYPDWAETADQGGRSPLDCARRLARMLGRDLEADDLPRWRAVARYFAGVHARLIRESVERILSRPDSLDTPLVGAGVGRFIVIELARQLARSSVDFSDFMNGPARLRAMAAVCAPAAALAHLLRSL